MLGLRKASLNGNLEEIKRLVEEKHLNPLQRVGKTASNALHCAAAAGHLRYFIEDRGCSAACVDQDGWTPLNYAALHKHLDIVQYLVKKQQIEPFGRTDAGTTALHHACIGGNIDVIHFLATMVPHGWHSRELLELAHGQGHQHIVKYLKSISNMY